MKQYKDVVVVTGTYTAKDNTQKKQYTNVGFAIIDDEKGISIKLDKHFNPAGISGDCWLSLYDRKDKQHKVESENNSLPEVNPNTGEVMDDIPF
jgi:hypothetical protein